MVQFLDMKTENKFRRFVAVELAEIYNQPITVEDAQIVTGLIGEDVIEEALIVRFYPEDADVENVHNWIKSAIHKYCYENGLKLNLQLEIQRDIWCGKIRYGLVYTKS